ncbi:MAG: iron ABC transporter permease [Betaproteobacteria bacterium]|nr:ABC transporter permease subunit [Betaproteobacteria bacterium]MDE1954215.1 iron ABC transporter permease [Betaproteobacteria bacterium]MDE2151662.1 iron ABC transporter permease [Betaproteobacteria bacterium]
MSAPGTRARALRLPLEAAAPPGARDEARAPWLRRARHRAGPVLGTGLLALAALALWGWPLGGFLGQALVPGLLRGALHPSLAAFAQAWTDGGAGALRNSWLISLLASLIALPLGAWLAWLRERSLLAWRGWIEAGVWLLLVLPGYFVASGWMLLAAPVGPLAHWPWLLAFAQNLLGPPGIVISLAFKALPYTFLALQLSLRALSAAPQEAARVLGLGRAQRLRLAVHALLPALAAGFAAAFAESASDFAVAATLGAGSGTVLATYAIQQSVAAMPVNFPAAAAASWMLLGLVAPALWLQAAAGRRASAARSVGARHRPAAPRALAPAQALAHGCGAALLGLLALGVPLLSAASLAFGGAARGDAFARAAAQLLPAFGYSLRMAVLAASAATALAWPAARSLASGKRLGRAVDLGLTAAMALPGIVLAAAYVQMYNLSVTPWYGGSALLAMAYVALALPAATRLLQGPLAQLHGSLGEAARVHGLSRLQTLLRVEAPLLAPALGAAWLMAALHVAFELPASQLLYPPGHAPLAVALLDAASGFQLRLQARLQLLGIALLLGFAALARWTFTRAARRMGAAR